MWWRILRPVYVDQPVVDAVQRVAESRGIPMSKVALAWLLGKPVVSAPIVGATKPRRLAYAAVAMTVDEIRQLEELYTPQALNWW
jgi:aryl-alcohol dehydrogenase-like predicted oxidoreductase